MSPQMLDTLKRLDPDDADEGALPVRDWGDVSDSLTTASDGGIIEVKRWLSGNVKVVPELPIVKRVVLETSPTDFQFETAYLTRGF